MHADYKQTNITTLFFVAATCVITGGLIGAVTNMINGAISPYYYQAIMYWDFSEIWTAAIAQGIMEGLLYGVIFSLIFTITFGLVTKGKGTYKFAFKQITKLIFIVLTCWVIGGLIAIFLANLSPNFYRSHFPLTPTDTISMSKFAWVGGSIWGGIMGGLISAAMAIVMIRNNWRQTTTFQHN